MIYSTKDITFPMLLTYKTFVFQNPSISMPRIATLHRIWLGKCEPSLFLKIRMAS